MAYAFRAIDELMSPDQQKQNIFSSEQAQGQQPGQPGQQAEVKTNTEGEVASGGGSSASVSEGAAPQVTDTGAANRAAFKANIGKTQTPKALNDVQSQLQQRSANLQEQANQYFNAGKAGQQYTMSSQDLDKAIGGEGAQRDAARGLLNRQNLNQFEDFKPGDVEVKDTNLLNTDAGLKKLVARGMGPRYSQGMAAFDVQSLRRTPNFDNILRTIRSDQDALRKQSQDLVGSKRAELESYGKQQLAAAQKGAKDYLGSQATAIDQANEQEAATANALLKKYRAEGVPDAEKKALEDARSAVTAMYDQVDPRFARFVSQAGADPRKALKVRDDYGRDEFVDAGESRRFNDIMSLLGQGDSRLASGARGPDYTVDRAALENQLVKGTQGLRAAEDKRLEDLIAGVKGEAQKRADAEDVRRSQLNLNKLAEQEAANARKGISSLGNYSKDSLYEGLKLMDPSSYLSRDMRDLGAADAYTAEDVKKLNDMYKDLGSADRASVGQLGNAYNFDQAGYQSALEKLMSEYQKNKTTQQLAAAERAAQQQHEISPYIANVYGLPMSPEPLQGGPGFIFTEDPNETLLGVPSQQDSFTQNLMPSYVRGRR